MGIYETAEDERRMGKQNADAISVRWDETVPGNHGWLVLTATAGWQPPRGDLPQDASHADLAAMARCEVLYHDGKAAPDGLDSMPVLIARNG